MSRKGLIGLWGASAAVFAGALLWSARHPEMRVIGAEGGSPLFTAVTILLLLMFIVISFLVLLNVVTEIIVRLLGDELLDRVAGTPVHTLLWDELKVGHRPRR